MIILRRPRLMRDEEGECDSAVVENYRKQMSLVPLLPPKRE
jgi:hypothetical protein